MESGKGVAALIEARISKYQDETVSKIAVKAAIEHDSPAKKFRSRIRGGEEKKASRC